MIKLNFKNRFFSLVLALSLLVLIPDTFGLLQGNRLLPLGPKGTESLEMDFEVDESASEAEGWIKLGPLNLSEMSYLSLWVKNQEFSGEPVNLLVEIQEDTNSNKRFVFGEDVASRASAVRLTGAGEEKNWRRIVIPFSAFRQVKNWDRILELGFIVQIKRGSAKGKLLIDRLQGGLHYPEGIQGKEIRMQNRVSSFKIGNRVANPETALKRAPIVLTLTMTFIDPYLEEVRFEETLDGAKTWKPLESFYDHQQGGVYKTTWNPQKTKTGGGVQIRAVGVSVLGGEAKLAGPYRVSFN